MLPLGGRIFACPNSVADEAESERIKRLQVLCEQLEALQEQAKTICKEATAEIRRAKLAGQLDRRMKTKKVRRERRSG
jgi:hypothetical protein